jgi:hypothetical protein
MRTTFAPDCSRLTTGKLAALLVLWAACAVSGTATATALYDPGPLNFSTVNQSMWGPGNATIFTDSVFVGPQWTNRTVGVGGFTGSLNTVTINTNPAWWAWKACVETINFLCGGEPAKGQVQEVVDTRTGARVDLTTSGKFGLEFGYTVNSGSVDAAAGYSASAVLPDGAKQGQFFNLNPDSTLQSGSIASQSPKIEAYLNAIAQLSGSVTARACLITFGCTEQGTLTLPSVNLSQPVISINPNTIKILPDLLPPKSPGEPRRPLAEPGLINHVFKLQGVVDATGTPGFKLTKSEPGSTTDETVVDTTPPTPDVSFDLASLQANLPDIATSSTNISTAVKNGNVTRVVTSGGRDDFLTMLLDVDGLAFILGGGSIPPLGLGITLLDKGGFKLGLQLDALDIDIGPVIGITQDFELEPTLMARLNFDNPVMIAGLNGLQSVWEGRWDSLPDIALQETTTITPEFWLEAMLTNSIGIDLGLMGTWAIDRFVFSASVAGIPILKTPAVSLNSLLGLGDELFSTDKLRFPIWELPFALGGFSQAGTGSPRITAAAFTIEVTAVPTPGTLDLLLVTLVAAAFVGGRRAMRIQAQGR